MKRLNLKIKSFFPLFFFLALIIVLVPLIVFGDEINTRLGGYQVLTGTTKSVEVMFPDGQTDCAVKNNSSNTYFIPTKLYSPEWLAFVGHKPLYVTAGCCGDQSCDASFLETVFNCPPDCQVGYCGNSVCDPGETAVSCPFDCTYGACLQDGNTVGWISDCPIFLTSGSCDSVHCIWSGSYCSAKITPSAETCNPITVSTTCNAIYGCTWVPGAHRVYWWCGDDQCTGAINENITSCPQDCGGSYCGDGACGSGENCSNCYDDCGACPAVCGNSICEATEDCCSCSSDCPSCPGTCLGPLGCEAWINKMAFCNAAGNGCYWGTLQCN